MADPIIRGLRRLTATHAGQAQPARNAVTVASLRAAGLADFADATAPAITHIKNIIIDDVTYVMRKEYFKTAKVSGYNKFVDIGAHFQSIISTIESMREDLNVFLLMHCEEIVSDNVIVGYKASTIGKLIDNSYNPVEVVPMLLFSSVKYDESKKPVYGFYTHRCIEGTVEIPAKSPEGMFEEDFIPNDLGFVVNKMNEYYNG